MDQGFFYLSPTLFLDALPIAVSYTCVLVEGSIVGTRKSPQRMIPGPKDPGSPRVWKKIGRTKKGPLRIEMQIHLSPLTTPPLVRRDWDCVETRPYHWGPPRFHNPCFHVCWKATNQFSAHKVSVLFKESFGISLSMTFLSFKVQDLARSWGGTRTYI